jgi:hypothetical protein
VKVLVWLHLLCLRGIVALEELLMSVLSTCMGTGRLLLLLHQLLLLVVHLESWG